MRKKELSTPTLLVVSLLCHCVPSPKESWIEFQGHAKPAALQDREEIPGNSFTGAWKELLVLLFFSSIDFAR